MQSCIISWHMQHSRVSTISSLRLSFRSVVFCFLNSYCSSGSSLRESSLLLWLLARFKACMTFVDADLYELLRLLACCLYNSKWKHMSFVNRNKKLSNWRLYKIQFHLNSLSLLSGSFSRYTRNRMSLSCNSYLLKWKSPRLFVNTSFLFPSQAS